jgi:hypothetical protein
VIVVIHLDKYRSLDIVRSRDEVYLPSDLADGQLGCRRRPTAKASGARREHLVRSTSFQGDS